MENVIRCPWCANDELYTKYHDTEWGKTVTDDHTLFEFLVLESAQAGLSWITILRRREGYKRLFANFDVQKVASFTQDDVERLMLDPAIIRNKLKIVSTINNAKLFIEIQKEFGSFYNYLYSFLPNKAVLKNEIHSMSDIPIHSKESDAISKDMKKRGFKFFGTTICYAYMQAVGMINDHLTTCTFRD